MSALSILDVQHLTKTYDTGAGKLTVLKDISFTLPAGSTCVQNRLRKKEFTSIIAAFAAPREGGPSC